RSQFTLVTVGRQDARIMGRSRPSMPEMTESGYPHNLDSGRSASYLPSLPVLALRLAVTSPPDPVDDGEHTGERDRDDHADHPQYRAADQDRDERQDRRDLELIAEDPGCDEVVLDLLVDHHDADHDERIDDPFGGEGDERGDDDREGGADVGDRVEGKGESREHRRVGHAEDREEQEGQD